MANTHPATRTRMREETPTDAHGSRTLTVHETQEQSEDEENISSEGDEIGVLRLRGDMNSRNPRAIRWASDVIDNEHMNKKKSKSKIIKKERGGK